MQQRPGLGEACYDVTVAYRIELLRTREGGQKEPRRSGAKVVQRAAVTLRAWCQTDSGYVFQIIDTGINIAPEDIPKALSRFGQVDGDPNRQYAGTGLGLPLTKSLVGLHGGSFDLQSEVGVGTTVTVRFPAERIVASLDNSDSLDVEDRVAS